MQSFSELLCIDGSGSKDARNASSKTPIYRFSSESRQVSRVCTRNQFPLSVFRDACRDAQENRKLLIAADLPIGLPVEPADVYGELNSQIFLKWLESTERKSAGAAWRTDLIANGVEERTRDRPFVDVKKNESIGNWAGKRRCDQVSGGSSIYVVGNSAKQVGKAALQFWFEILQPLRTEFKSKIAVWPFESIDSASVIVGECYPRLCQKHLYDKVIRKRDAQSVVSSLDIAKLDIERDFKISFRTWLHASSSEDEFDMFTTAVSLGKLQLSGINIFAHPDDANVVSLEGWMLGLPAIADANPRIGTKARKAKTQTNATAFPCPIPDCDHVFYGGRGGWDPHVASLNNHKNWRPDLKSGEERKTAFRQEFPEFF